MENQLILISEFQPIHTLHEKEIIKAIKSDIANILFCIDGAHRKIHADSPLTTKERANMIHILMKEYAIPYTITYLRDSDDDDERLDMIQKLIQQSTWDKIMSDDSHTYSLLKKSWLDSYLLEENFQQSTIRNQFAANNTQEAKKKLPISVFNYLDSIDMHQRMKKNKINAFWWPNLAVDIVIENDKWEIAIIERVNEPFWAGLPGGMIDRSEVGSFAAAREADEEAWAKGIMYQSAEQNTIYTHINQIASQYNLLLSWEIQPFTVQTNPNRDLRGHIMTLWYYMKYNGDLKKWSDAKSVQWMKPEDALRHPHICQAHKEIIISYMAQF